MDMWEPYITVVGKKAPQARVIFDRFHIVKHLNEAVDKTRRELVRELKGTARRNLKNTKFPLLKAKHNRSAKDKRVLREQVRANRRLYRAMLLRDDFMDLYTYKTETWAKKFLRYVSTTLRHSRAAFSEPRLASGGSWRRCGPHLHRSRSRFVEQKKGVPRYGRRRESGLCGIQERRFLRRRVDPSLRRQNGRLWRFANEAFGMSPMSFEKDLAPSGGELFGATIVNVGRRHEADS